MLIRLEIMERSQVRVVKGKNSKWREVPVFPGRELAVLDAVKCKASDAHVFERISSVLDIHSYRRQFAGK